MTLILFMLNALGPVEAVENFLSMCLWLVLSSSSPSNCVSECPLRMGLNALGLVDSPPLDCLTV